MVLARGPGSGMEKGLRSDSGGIEGAVIARRSGSFPGFDEVEKQNGRERNNERAANQRRASCLEGIGEGVLDDVDPTSKIRSRRGSRQGRRRCARARRERPGAWKNARTKRDG